MIRKVIKDIYAAIKDPGREIKERVFLHISFIAVISAIIALIGDIVFGENIFEIITLAGVIVFIPVITVICMYKNKMSLAVNILSLGFVAIVLPALFFFGGGVEGGGIIWVIFIFVYVGLLLSGKLKAVVLFLLLALSAAFYLIGYYHPELVHTHSREVFYIDSFISLILVAVVCLTMAWFQNQLFIEENLRAKKEAERAEDLTRAQNRFFSSMSHEIRTPINSILGLNELILRDQTASEEIVKDASGIQGAGKMLLALINDILDFSKMEAGSMDIVPVDYNVGNMLSEIVNMIWLRAHDKGLGFNVSIDPEVPSVLYGDEVRIKQVIINLLNNAVKYTQEGSVSLHIESDDNDGDSVILRISISDTGMGIKKEAIPFLFDAFKRVDEEKNMYIEGTGLGLSIVKQIVELMNGTVSVNSVYGEGSMFTVELKQQITNNTGIGELNIHNQQSIKRNVYTSSFTAPEASILIVDDNEMNLEVECKLLSETEMFIDKALSGKEALEKTLKRHYDTILMDHLMPEMDGIECLNLIRDQEGGLNRTSPVVVLTANAGSDNRELYNRAGFDGYLVKPVSGEALEATLIKHIANEKMIIKDAKMSGDREDINTLVGYSGKVPVIITSSSMCDLPDSMIKRINLPVIPFLIRTEEGIFKDGEQMGADELIRYMNQGKKTISSPPDESDYTEFFADVLRKAHHVIHIALTTSLSEDLKRATEAAKSFENVTVINSGCISSATGIMVLIAHKLAQQNMPVEEITKELEHVRERLQCSFVIDTTEYMARRGLISQGIHRLARNLNLHPCLKFKNDRLGIGGIWTGKTRRAYKKYINKAFPVDIIPDPDIVFITYADVPIDTLLWVKEEISKIAYFEHVIFKQASAAITSNCGPGTLGILYFVKSNKSYNLGSYVDDHSQDMLLSNNDDHGYDEDDETESAPITFYDVTSPVETVNANGTEDGLWYRGIEGIDPDEAIKNSGSEDAFKTVLKIFYDSIPVKSSELEKFFSSEDWSNYTIKIHALKSSARLIGASELADKAQLLEDAGKASDKDYIGENHDPFMKDYLKFKDILREIFEDDGGKTDDIRGDNTKPVADDSLMKGVYEGLKEAAEAMDCDAIDEIFGELKDYSIPDKEKAKYDLIIEKAGNFDYEGILEVLARD
ncbi:MAG: DegV family EDD domain-containing protein [Lachnospiraceae bacterium]|nr:DegV family EDD domain-containing protein [Lachnospiraceae bacterium]